MNNGKIVNDYPLGIRKEEFIMLDQEQATQENIQATQAEATEFSAPTLEELSQIFQVSGNEDDSEAKQLSEGKQLEQDLSQRKTHLYDIYDKQTIQSAFSFAEDYRTYLDNSKTEREAVNEGIRFLKTLGFADIAAKEKLKSGDKVYQSIRGKGLMAAVIGEETLKNGFAVLGAHIDSPRLDLKPNALYEDGEMALLKTHYYGGVKKYQWTTIPLALHGTVVRRDGSVLNFVIGEKEDDPVFMLSDLLIHLSRDQMKKTASEVVTGEDLNILIGGRPLAHKDVSERFKLAILQILKSKYQLTQRDLLTAEISAVPAGKTRDLGLDRSFLAGYGHDDRVCAYPALRAIASVDKNDRTAVMVLTDKEEVGSPGNTGAMSRMYENFLQELFYKSEEEYTPLDFAKALEKSHMLSTDVTVAYDPNFPSVVDTKNVCYMGHGVAVTKYTGHGGKSGCNDANSEFFAQVANLLDDNNLPWQTGELGKVDQGGGGTIAAIYAELGMQVIDCGVPVLNMHAPNEIIHKLDLYSTYEAYRAFIRNIR